MIYLDYNATAPMKPAVRAAVSEAMERQGNPSSVHRFGRTARRHMEEARASVAALVGVKPAQVIFTSGGTEANNMIFRGLADRAAVTSTIEHDSVLAASPNALRLPVNKEGLVDLEKAEAIFRATAIGSVVSVMLVNNETGAVQPVADLAALAKKFGHLVHTDAVQAAGRLPLDFAALGVDALTLSAHKISGPHGIGALIVSEKLVLASMMKGGGQEMNRRAGTENVAGIVGFGIAAKLAIDDLRDMPRLQALRDRFEKSLEAMNAVEGALVIAQNVPRVPNTLCVAMRGMPSETQVAAMDLGGVAVSAGSACSSGKVKASHVLRAMGYADDVAGSAIRISLGWTTSTTDIDRCIDVWSGIFDRSQNKQKAA